MLCRKKRYKKCHGFYVRGSCGSTNLYTSNLMGILMKQLAEYDVATKKQKVELLVQKTIDKNKMVM